MRTSLLIFLLLLTGSLSAQVKITSLRAGKAGYWLSYNFPFVQASNKSVADAINNFLQSEILYNEIISADTSTVFQNSRYINNDSFSQAGYSMIDYRIELNTGQVLSLIFDIESTGAYSSNYQKHYCFSTQTGKRLAAKDLFTGDGIKAISKRLIADRKKIITSWVKEMRTEYNVKEDSVFINETFAKCNTSADEDNFFIRTAGIRFCKRHCFPHLARPYDTNLDVELGYKALEAYLSPAGKLLLLNQK